MPEITVTPDRRRRGTKALLRAIEAARERAMDPDYHVTVRLMPAVHSSYTLPGTMTLQEAIDTVAAKVGGKFLFCINTPENLTFWCSQEGKVTSVTGDG